MKTIVKFIPGKDLPTLTFNGDTHSLKLRSEKRIDWEKKTVSRSHYHSRLGLYMADPMVKGNTKLDPSLLIFDLLAIATCKNCRTCAHDCYAKNAQVQYPTTYNKRAINTWLARYDRAHLETMIFSQLSRTNRTTVRIHSSGDFDSQEYIDMWTRIISKFPHIKFYAYTKVNGIFDFSLITSLKNFNLVESILPDGDVNFGSMEYISSKRARWGGAFCPYGIEGLEPVKCGDDCRICMETSRVYFLIH